MTLIEALVRLFGILLFLISIMLGMFLASASLAHIPQSPHPKLTRALLLTVTLIALCTTSYGAWRLAIRFVFQM